MRDDDPRGYTYTPQWRHECEVRYVLAMPTKAARQRYLFGDAPKDAQGRPMRTRPDGSRYSMGIAWHRGEEAAQRLIDDVRAAWRGTWKPQLPGGDEAGAIGAVARGLSGARHDGAPEGGSFPAAPGGGPLRRGVPVESGAAA